MRLSKATKRAIVQHMRDRLSQPYAWGKGQWRRDHGRAPEGVQLCLLGACQESYAAVTGKKPFGDGGDVAEALSLAALARARMVEQGNLAAANWGASSTVFSFNDMKTTSKKDSSTGNPAPAATHSSFCRRNICSGGCPS